MIELSLDTDSLRARYRPNKITVLFVREAPPAGGTFFYRRNGQVFRYLEEVLQAHLGQPDDFLLRFMERRYFLDDLVLKPVGDKITTKERRSLYRANVPALAERMIAFNPKVVVTILERICPYVEEAISLARLNVTRHCVPFPGNGRQGDFRQQMEKIVPLLRSN